MNIRALVKRIRAGIRARIPGRGSRRRHGPWSRSGLSSWEAFDEKAFQDLVEDIDKQAGEEADELSQILRNLN